MDRHVIHLETLQALLDCNCLALFASKSISLPIEQFWIQHVRRTFYGQFLAHVILLVSFAFYNTIRQRNKADRLRQADDDDEEDRLVRPELPAHERHEPEKDRRDAADRDLRGRNGSPLQTARTTTL